jgi:hypothetical protein
MVVRHDDEIIGYIHEGGCENNRCITHVINGLKWHATPARSAVILNPNHFRTVEDAILALKRLEAYR